MTFQGASGFNPIDPDAPKYTIKAWRGFRGWCVPNLDTGELKSTNWDYSWTVGVNSARHMPFRSSWGPFPAMASSVFAPYPKDCEYPTTDCSCGFYAYHGEDYWWDSGYPSSKGPMIAGIIEGFGRMVVASKGFRAGKAVILALAAPVAVEQRWLDERKLTIEETQARVFDAVRARYWNVPIYDTIPELLATHPLRDTEDEP